jgi:hypothetical protein
MPILEARGSGSAIGFGFSSGSTGFVNGKAVLALGLPSGVYPIKPEGYTGDPIECYVDNTTDGGGWVLCGAYSTRANYTMDAYQNGLFETEVKSYYNQVRPVWNGSSGGPAHLNKAFIDKLFNQTASDKSYMGTVSPDVSTNTVHWKLVQKSANYSSSFNAFGAVYATGLCNNTFNSVHSLTGSSSPTSYVGRSLGTASTNYTNGRSGYLSPYQDAIYHYLPDDLGGSYRWMFRENADDASHNAIGNTTNDIFFIR